MSNKFEATFGVGPGDEPESLGQLIRRTGPYATAQKVPQRLSELRAEDFNQLRDELNEPRMGLATTRELLQEIRTRAEVPTPLPWIVKQITDILIEMPEEALAYRTVDPL